MIAPGVERVDTVKTDSGYEMKSIWSRNDLSDTSILKLSTATGYIYGYVQDLKKRHVAVHHSGLCHRRDGIHHGRLQQIWLQ